VNASENASPWLTRPTCIAARARLLLIPYAGAGPSVFAAWRSLPEIDLRIASLPGRETRAAEPLEWELWRVVERLESAVEVLGSTPLFIFGHSLGALIGFELARRLELAGAKHLRGFVASGAAGPRVRRRFPPISQLPDGELWTAAAERYGGTAPEVLGHPELADYLAPILRADLRMYETYRVVCDDKLRAPILAIGGEADPVTTLEEVRRWQDVSVQPIEFRSYSGGHFFLREQSAAVLNAVTGFMDCHG
jgi:surfactin synthase thioesterase subunit